MACFATHKSAVFELLVASQLGFFLSLPAQTIDKMGMGGIVGQAAGVVDQLDNAVDGVRMETRFSSGRLRFVVCSGPGCGET